MTTATQTPAPSSPLDGGAGQDRSTIGLQSTGRAGATQGEGVNPSRPVLVVIAHGTPGPQGSKNGRVAPNGTDVIMRESSKKVKPWRRAVREAAQLALPVGWQLLDEPLEIEMTFTLHKGHTVRRSLPTVYPDLSKLARSTEDAMTGVVWKDDARIVRYRNLSKTYPLEGLDALNYPGVVVRIYTIAGT